MNYNYKMITTGAHYFIEAMIDGYLFEDVDRAEVADARDEANAHRWASSMLKMSAIYNGFLGLLSHESAKWSRLKEMEMQVTYDCKNILMLPAGLYETASNLYRGKRLEALTYFGHIVLPGVLSLGRILPGMSLLSIDNPFVRSVETVTATYSMPRNLYDSFVNHTGF